MRDPRRPEGIQIYKPRGAQEDADARRKRREQWFRALNSEIVARSDCWIISTPHAPRVILEQLESSPMAAELIARGYKLEAEPDGERILPFAISTAMEIAADGTLIPATIGSTKPVTMTHHAAGIAKTLRYSFPAP